MLVSLLGACAPFATPTPIPLATFTPVAETQRPIETPSGATSAPVFTPTRSLATPVPNTAETARGKFVFTPGDGSLWLYTLESRELRNVFKPSATTYADAPSFSPDGSEILYVLSTLDAQNRGHDSLRVLRVDGAGERVVLEPSDARVSFISATYSHDGEGIYFTANVPLPDGARRYDIQRIPAQGGMPQTLIENARQPTLSPDGKRMAFIRFNAQTITAALWLADSDGTNARLLLADDVFLIINAPRFSPDGQTILFAASGPNLKPLPEMASRSQCAPQIFCAFAAPALAATDGLPWDLWTVTADGKKFARLTNVGADSPYPAWSRDGSHIAFMDPTGLYFLNLETHTITQLNKNGAHGVFDWWEP